MKKSDRNIIRQIIESPNVGLSNLIKPSSNYKSFAGEPGQMPPIAEIKFEKHCLRMAENITKLAKQGVSKMAMLRWVNEHSWYSA